MIQFENVSKKFSDGTFGVVDINLEIKDGEFVFLVGQSGAGKTTFLKLLTCQIKPTSGIVKINDKNVTALKSGQLHKIRREIGIVFQDFKLLLDQTVYENIALALEVSGRKEKTFRKTILDTLQKVGLEGRERYFPAQLSGGELQRTAIARALATEAKILIADEPTGDLDPKTAWGILQLLDEINKNGTTVIMATHNHNIVDAMRKRVITIDHGRVVTDIQESGYLAPEQSEETPVNIEENVKSDKKEKV
jgi:cell division transport system ATP-binding protein